MTNDWCEDCGTERSVCHCKPTELQAVYDERRKLQVDLTRIRKERDELRAIVQRFLNLGAADTGSTGSFRASVVKAAEAALAAREAKEPDSE